MPIYAGYYSDFLLTSYCCHLLFLFQIMRETLIYLSHLDHDDTEQQVCLIKGFCNLLIHESYFNFSGCQGKFSHDAVSVWYWVRFRVKFTQTGMGYVWNKWFSRIIHRQICEHYWGFWNIRMIKQIHRIDSFSFGFRGTQEFHWLTDLIFSLACILSGDNVSCALSLNTIPLKLLSSPGFLSYACASYVHWCISSCFSFGNFWK